MFKNITQVMLSVALMTAMILTINPKHAAAASAAASAAERDQKVTSSLKML